jgi:hypothetical protein
MPVLGQGSFLPFLKKGKKSYPSLRENRNREGSHLINCFIFSRVSGISLSLFNPERVKTIILKIPGLDLI